MKHILSIAGALALASAASAQVLATDDFSYTGSLTANGWTAHSGAGNKEIQSNGSFAILDFSGGSGEDVNLAFPPLTATDDVYASFTLNVPSGNPVNPDNNGSYFAHFKDAGFAFRGRFGLLSPAGTGDFQVAINASSSSLGGGAVWPDDLVFDTDYTIVISYDAATGESKLWVDPRGSASASVSHTGTAGDLIESIALRQAADHTGFIHVDNILVGNEFADVVDCANSLTTTFASNNGQAGNMFDLRPGNAPIEIDCFDVNLDAGTWDLEIYTTTSGGSHVGIEQDPTAWTLLATVTGVTSLGANIPTPVPLSAPLDVPIGCGEQRGFYVTVTNGTSINYTTGTGYLVGDVFASNDDIEFLAGTGNVYPFANVFGPPSGTRVFNGNIYYAVQPGQLCGRSIPYGAGCGAAAASYYEQTDAANFDLAGQTVTGTWNGSGYDVSTAAGSVAPVGGAAIALPLGDDDSLDTNTVGGTLGLWVGSNCWIALGGGNSNGFSPSSSTLLSNPATGVYAWTDLRPLQTSGSGLGTVYYEENGALATVTFDGVEGWNTGLPNTVQFTYDTASGDYSITFGTLSTSNPEDWLVGYSVGGASVDPGPTDISAGSFSTPATDTQALALSSSVPVVGQTWTLEFDNISGPYAWFFFGDVAIDPGYDMTPDGAPGCFAHTNGTVGVWAQPVTASSAQMAVGIPAAASLIGVELTVQGAGRDFGNALGVSTSNGLYAKVGS